MSCEVFVAILSVLYNSLHKLGIFEAAREKRGGLI